MALAKTKEKKLTPLGIAELKADPNGPYAIRDKDQPGLRIVVYPTGKKSFVMFYRNPQGVLRKYTLGSFAGSDLPTAKTALDDARQKVRDTKTLLDKAKTDEAAAAIADPALQKRETKAAIRAPVADDDKYPAVAIRYLDDWRLRDKPKPKTIEEKARCLGFKLNGEWKPLPTGLAVEWAEKRFDKISKADVQRYLDDVMTHGARGNRESGSPVAANRTKTKLRELFQWARDRDIITKPVDEIVVWKAVRENARDRYLTPEEIKAFWKATGDMPYPHGPLLRLLLLTGQRKNEIGHMVKDELDLTRHLWTLPTRRAKNGNEHVLPLPDDVLAILTDLPTFDGPYLFSYNAGVSPVTDPTIFHAQKDCLARMEAELGRTYAKEEKDKTHGPCVVHDLRRTFSTHCNEGPYAPFVEPVLNHVPKGVKGTYNRAAYLRGKYDLLTWWSREVTRIAEGKPAETDNVLPFLRA